MTGGENAGALAESQRRRRYWTLMGLALLASVVIGLTGRVLGGPEGPISPALAIGLAAGLLVLGVGGNWIYFRHIDELEVASNLVGGFWGFYAFIMGWPLWLILWRGGFLPEPDTMTIYFITAGVALLGFCWKRFR